MQIITISICFVEPALVLPISISFKSVLDYPHDSFDIRMISADISSSLSAVVFW